MQRIIKAYNPVIYSEKFKDLFMPFLVRNLNITGYNLLCITIHDDVLGPIGVLIFGNKQIEKERKTFDKNDEQLGEICASLIKTFLMIKDSEMVAKNIEDKNWKMSELVDCALASKTIKVILITLSFRNI
jgi:hypothetical protein